MNESIVVNFLVGLLAAGVGIASYWFLNLPQDNPIEEAAEEIIHVYVKLDGIDLSPNSPEMIENTQSRVRSV